MTPKRWGCAAVVALSLGLAAGYGVATYVPRVHAIHAPNARAVDARVGGSLLPYLGRVPQATTSLEQLRCAVWKELTRQSCDGVTVLPQRFWPQLTQMPATLYLPLATEGGLSRFSGPSGSNVEYQAGLRRILIHEYVAQPLVVWYHVESMPGAALAPGLVLLVISTAQMRRGVVNLQRDFWVERLIGDEAYAAETLGTAEIP